MTRYRVVRDIVMSEIVGVSREVATFPHPEQPSEGFPFATAANIFCVERDLDGSWYVIPVEGAL